MKQAILITAYKDVQSIIDIINFFDDHFNFYIHIDKKSKLDYTNLLNRDNIFVFEEFNVNWGGFNHLKAILLLMNEALKNNSNSYFHLITGEDFPIKSISYFLNIDTSKNYIKYYEMPASVWKDNGGYDRVEYYQLYDLFNYKKEYGKKIIELIVKLQKRFKFKRSLGDAMPSKLYGGSTYWSLNREVLEYLTNYLGSNKELLNRFRNTFCAEEILFHSIILNSPYTKTIINTHLRFIDWESGRGGYPAYLDESDFEAILKSESLFARKIRNSEKIRDMLISKFKS